MILYLDTSALVKKYFKEVGSEEIVSLWKEAEAIITSSVTYAEAMASFFNKKREVSIEDQIFQSIIKAFHHDWQKFIIVTVNNELNDVIDRLAAIYPLRGFDVIHLASAFIIHGSVPENFLFACFDQRISLAAAAENLKIFPKDNKIH